MTAKGLSIVIVRPLLTGKHLITSVQSRVYQRRKWAIADDVRMFDAATGELNHTKTEARKYNPRNMAHRNIGICPNAQARGNTLIIDGVKGPIAYRK